MAKINYLRFTVFISSRNNDRVFINGVAGDTLTEIRLQLQRKLESQLLFGHQFLKVRINESFAVDTGADSYAACMDEAKEADFVIALYNGYSGWAPDANDMGICHAELDAAFQVSSKKTAIIDVSRFFDIVPSNPEEKLRNKRFSDYVTKLNRFNNPLKLIKAQQNNEGFREALFSTIENLISNNLANRVAHSNLYYNLSSSNAVGLDWKQLNYAPRAERIKGKLTEMVKSSKSFEGCIKLTHAIPDKMSFADAKSYAVRPFLTDQDHITSEKMSGKDSIGPIHFIAVYASVTETQVKAMIGHPDISVIKDDFGYYLWEQHMHIQLIFLTECITPAAIQTKYLLFESWAVSSDEQHKIINRAEARSHILLSINNALKIANKK